MNILKYLTITAILIGLGSQVISAKGGNKEASLCIKHKLKTTECFICDSTLRVKNRLWCKEHDRYEDRCWKCHPDLQDKKVMYCKEHNLYENECYFCHPDSINAIELKKQSSKVTISEKCRKHNLDKGACFVCDPSLRKKGRLWCKEHDRYEDRCWKCHPDLQSKKRTFCKEHNLYEDECNFCNPVSKESAELERKTLSIEKFEEKCDKHAVDIKTCFICDSTVRTKGRLWCREHDRYEDRCWKCHPDIEDKKRPFCKEHYLYEDECLFCNPVNNKRGAIKNDPKSIIFCNEHQVPEHECGICQPELVHDLKAGESMKIRFASNKSVSKAGIETALAKESSSTYFIKAYSRIDYNQNAYAHISPLASGIVKKVLVSVGEDVEKGDVIAEINSMKIAEAKLAYLTSIANLKLKEKSYAREKGLFKEKVSSASEFQEAAASYEKAGFENKSSKQRLFNYGFSPVEIDHISKNSDSSSLLTIKAPFQGRILDRNVVVGELKTMGDKLFTLGDLSNMWLEITIPADKANFVQQGQRVNASFENSHLVQTKGEIIWVDTLIDKNSRMVKARAIIPNKNGKLKAGLFGYVNIMLDNPKKSLRVPRGAVHELENQPFVFVKVKDDLFDLRRIDIGNKNSLYVDIISGIKENEEIVVVGKFTMVSEYLKSRLGAGCVDD